MSPSRFVSGNFEHFQRLFEWVFSLPACPLDFKLQVWHIDPPLTSQAGYPSRTLHCSPDWFKLFVNFEKTYTTKTFREEGFEKSLLVTVHDNEA